MKEIITFTLATLLSLALIVDACIDRYKYNESLISEYRSALYSK